VRGADGGRGNGGGGQPCLLVPLSRAAGWRVRGGVRPRGPWGVIRQRPKGPRGRVPEGPSRIDMAPPPAQCAAAAQTGCEVKRRWLGAKAVRKGFQRRQLRRRRRTAPPQLPPRRARRPRPRPRSPWLQPRSLPAELAAVPGPSCKARPKDLWGRARGGGGADAGSRRRHAKNEAPPPAPRGCCRFVCRKPTGAARPRRLRGQVQTKLLTRGAAARQAPHLGRRSRLVSLNICSLALPLLLQVSEAPGAYRNGCKDSADDARDCGDAV
jgi:hypothetical protein